MPIFVQQDLSDYNIMMDATNKQPQEVTILRIKRKRNEEPLDALGTRVRQS